MDGAIDDEIGELLNRLDEDDEEEIQALLNDDNFTGSDDEDWEFDERLTQSTILAHAEVEADSCMMIVNGINCAAHTLQLAVKAAITLLDTQNTNVIKLATEVCKFLRKESTRNETKNRGLNVRLPSLDTKTRWSSTYLMVYHFFTLF